jgi:uncharacterized SAM-binding protein YcdF (DUF218 family)
VLILRAVIRLILWFIVVLIGATWLGRKLAAWLRGDGPRPAKPAQAPAPRESKLLHRDPSCGTYVSPEISITLDEEGQLLHFCSEQCREKYAGRSARTPQDAVAS